MKSHMFVAATISAALMIGLAESTPACAATTDRPTPTSVATAQFPCGYDGYEDNGQPFYNHCGRHDIVIEVDHFFWQTTYECVTPGVHRIDQGSSPWAIVGAEYDGHTCSSPGQVVVGP